MKKVLFLAIAMLVACSVSFAQDAKEIMKERKAIQKMAKQEQAAKEATKKAVREELVKSGENLYKQLDKVLGY